MSATAVAALVTARVDRALRDGCVPGGTDVPDGAVGRAGAALGFWSSRVMGHPFGDVSVRSLNLGGPTLAFIGSVIEPTVGKRATVRVMALGKDYAAQECSIARALEIVGERWTLL